MSASATGRPRRAHWPDRRAHRHRRRAHKVFAVVAVLLLVLPWFGWRELRTMFSDGSGAVETRQASSTRTGSVAADARPAPAPRAAVATARPATAVAAAPGATPVPRTAGEAPAGPAAQARLDAVREAAIAGDDAGVDASVEAMDQAARTAALLADRGSAVHRIEARTLVQEMPGVRAAGWIDPFSMLVVVSGPGLRSRTTIDGVCERLARRGDVTGIVVNVQDGTASTRARAGILGGACHPTSAYGASRDRTWAASGREDDPALDAARLARRAESMRILAGSTPELQAEPPVTPRSDAPIYLRLDPPAADAEAEEPAAVER